MTRTMFLARCAAAVVAMAAPLAPLAAQDLNVRHDAPPSAKAVTGRLLTKARNVAADQGDTLQRDVINTDCSDLQIGGQQQPDDERRKSLVREDATVVRGNVVNLCR